MKCSAGELSFITFLQCLGHIHTLGNDTFLPSFHLHILQFQIPLFTRHRNQPSSKWYSEVYSHGDQDCSSHEALSLGRIQEGQQGSFSFLDLSSLTSFISFVPFSYYISQLTHFSFVPMFLQDLLALQERLKLNPNIRHLTETHNINN